MGERLPNGSHSDGVAERVTIDQEIAFDLRDVLRGLAASYNRRPQLHPETVEAAFGNLDDSGRMRQDQLDPSQLDCAQVASFCVQWPAV
jgi:hypothetical protein